MKAAVCTEYGPPEVVHVTEVARPEPGDGELLIRVRVSTVNRTDCGYRSASPLIIRIFSGLRRPKRTILGCEFAGEVAALGAGVTSFAVGDRVFGYSEGPFGGHGEYMTVAQDSPVATMPEMVSFEEAAAATEGAHYALSFIRAARIRNGQDVLVNGATGAIGSAAVQILKSMGVTVTAVCATPHLELVRGLGADRVLDYTAGDFTQDSQRYDAVLDAVGKSTFGRCKRLLKPRGIYLSSELGPRAQNPLLALVTPLLRGKRVLFPIPKDDQEMVKYFADLMESRAFRPVIDRHYPLDEIVEAYRYVESGQKVGNVVIDVA